MTPEEKSLLERTYKLTEENNEILRSIRRSNRISNAMRILYWVVILGLSFSAYYLIQPYVNLMLNSLSSLSSVSSQLTGTADTVSNLKTLIDQAQMFVK